MNGPANEQANALCTADDTWEHHDQTDDHPCTRCQLIALLLTHGHADWDRLDAQTLADIIITDWAQATHTAPAHEQTWTAPTAPPTKPPVRRGQPG